MPAQVNCEENRFDEKLEDALETVQNEWFQMELLCKMITTN